MGIKQTYGRPRKYSPSPDSGTPELQKRRQLYPGMAATSPLQGLYTAGWIDETALMAGQRYTRLAFAAFRSMELRISVKSHLLPIHLRGYTLSQDDASVEQLWRHLCVTLPQDVKQTLDKLLLYPGELQQLSKDAVCHALQVLQDVLKT